MENILINYKSLYLDILKRTKTYLIDAHNSDLKFNKSKIKKFSLRRIINQINKISVNEIEDFNFEDEIIFVSLPNDLDFHYFPRLLLINIINKNHIVFVQKKQSSKFLLKMLISISNSFAREFGNKADLFFLRDRIVKGEEFSIEINQLKTKQRLNLVKKQQILNFN